MIVKTPGFSGRSFFMDGKSPYFDAALGVQRTQSAWMKGSIKRFIHCWRRCSFLARRQPTTSFRAWPGIHCISLRGSRINVTSRARWRPGWRILYPGVQRTQSTWTTGSIGRFIHCCRRSSSFARRQPVVGI